MAESTDRHFLRPRELLSAARIDFFDAINLVIYAKLPLLSVLKGRDLIAGYVRRDEAGGIKPLKSFHGETELLERYAHHIRRFTFPVGPSVYEPLLDHMSRANEYALPYFFHEHHLMVDRRRRAALFALQYKNLQGDVMNGNVSLQMTDAELASMPVAGSWMTNDTLKAYLRKTGVLPWWEDEANLSSHVLLERMVLSDSLTRLPTSTPSETAQAPQRLPEPFSPRWTEPRNQTHGPANTPETTSQGHTSPESEGVPPSPPFNRGFLQRILASVASAVSPSGAHRGGNDEASGQANPTKAGGTQTSSVPDQQQERISPQIELVGNQHPDADTRSEAISVEVRLITPPIPPEHEAYDEQQAPSFLLAEKLVRHSRFRSGDQQAPQRIQAHSVPLKASDLPHIPADTLGSPVVTATPREKGEAATTEPPLPVTHHQQVATGKGDIGATKRDSTEEHGLGNQCQAPTDQADPYADETLMTRDDVAVFLNRHVNSVDNYRKQPGFPEPVYIGDSPMWKRGEIRKWRDRKLAK